MAIEIDRIIRTKRRTLTLIVEDDGSLVVRAPLKISEKIIHQFVDSNALWIEKKQAQARLFVPSSAKQYIPGEEFLYLGNPYALELVKGQKKPLLLEGSFKLAERSQKMHRKYFRNGIGNRLGMSLVNASTCLQLDTVLFTRKSESAPHAHVGVPGVPRAR